MCYKRVCHQRFISQLKDVLRQTYEVLAKDPQSGKLLPKTS